MNLFVAGWSETGADRGVAERALHDLLERLPFFDPANVESWQSADGRAAAACVAHPPEQTGGVAYSLLEPERMALWSGRPIRWSGERSAGGRAPLDPASYLDDDWVEGLDGRSTAVRFANGELEAYSDRLGAYPLYETEANGTAWLSNNAELLRGLRGTDEVEPDVLASVLGGGWSLSGDPLWAGIHRLPRGVLQSHVAGRPPRRRELLPLAEIAPLLGAGFDAERAAALLVESVRALADWPGRPSVVPLTGGRDSRLVFAAALAAGLPFEIRTGGEPGTPDVEVARELAGVAGREHRLLEHDPHGDPFECWRRSAELLRLGSSGTASLADAAGYPLGPRGGPLVLWHSGQGGEIARGYYGEAAAPDRNGVAERLYRRFVGRRPGRTELLSEEGERRVRKQVRAFVDEQLDAGVDPADVPDMFYLLKRMGTWAGAGHGAVELVRDTTSPLWSPRLLPDLLGLPSRERARETFHLRVLEQLAPQLVDVPFEHGQGWPAEQSAARRRAGRALELAGKAGAEAARRARGLASRARPGAAADTGSASQDSFAAAQSELRDLLPERAAHPVWEVVERDRVERLLARDPASLDTMSRYYVWRLAGVLG